MSVLVWIAAFATAAAGGVYLFRQARAFFRIIERAAGLLQSELTNNSGTSMKDNVEAAAEDLHGIAVAVGMNQRLLDDLSAALAGLVRRIEQLEGQRIVRVEEEDDRKARHQND